jgi:PIN domain nuclease of toxin-antitoxin system
VLTSAVAIWEISIKSAAGRLQPPVDDLRGDLKTRRIDVLPIAAEHAWAAGRLPPHHGDPFDRLLVAQAQLEGLTIVTRDPAIARYQVAILPA